MSVTVIRAARLIDGTGRPPVQDGAVVVEGTRLAYVGRWADVSVPDGATVIDRGDETLLPGLIDAHTHLSIIPGLGNQIGQLKDPPGKALMRAVGNIRKDLRAGVTTMRIVGEEHFLDLDVKKAVEAGALPGPRLLCATRPIVASHGHGAALTLSDGPDAIRRHIRENLAAGADLIKYFATGGTSSDRTSPYTCFYSPEEIRLIIEEAHRYGVRVATHAHGGPAIRWSAEAGVDSIEHGRLATAADLDVMRRHKTWLVCNYAISFHPDGIEKGDGGNPRIMEKLRLGREAAPQTFRLVLESGVRWALGTDSMHGLLWYEAAKAVEFGASPEQALAAVTRNAADVCSILDRTGTLEAGKLADVITVQGDPFADITALARPGLIMKEGRRWDHLSAE